MLAFFRRITASRIGRWFAALVLVLILIGFAAGDLANFGTGNIGFGLGSSQLASVGGEDITEAEMRQAVDRQLKEARQQNPTADFATISADYGPILEGLINQKAVIAFADKFGFRLSKRQVDAQIAQIPGAKGVNGKFDQRTYDQFLSKQKLTDSEIREIIGSDLLQRYLLVPLVTNPRLSVGMASPYAAMLLEQREGQAAAIPVGNFRAGLNPTDADLQRYYAANRTRYIVPEQRVLRIARVSGEQVANVTASDQEIAAAYNSDKAAYAPKDTRSLHQAVMQSQAAAAAVATKAKGGTALALAAGSAGALSTLPDQSRDGYSALAGPQAAAAVFAARQGDIVGPFKSPFGWVVTSVDAIKAQPGRTLDQARGEISAKLTTAKRKQAIEDLVDKLQNATDDGANFDEAAATAKLPVTSTPLILASGQARDGSYKPAPELVPAIKAGFDIVQNDPPEIVNLAGDQGYAMVSAARIVPAAPAPLATIRNRVAGDWIARQAQQRANAAARAIVAKIDRGMPLEQAMKEAKAGLPPVQPLKYRRIQVATAQGPVPPVLQMLFTVMEGKSRLVPDAKGGGYFIVKVNKVIPGNALLQPALITRMQSELVQPMQQEYAQQFVAAMRAELKVKRNDSAIAALKTRLASSGQ
ncbi:MAG: SurA N-terminal domain-containing protein [Sphingomicrobium sp.]